MRLNNKQKQDNVSSGLEKQANTISEQNDKYFPLLHPPTRNNHKYTTNPELQQWLMTSLYRYTHISFLPRIQLAYNLKAVYL
jgi:hypothetical protein